MNILELVNTIKLEAIWNNLIIVEYALIILKEANMDVGLEK